MHGKAYYNSETKPNSKWGLLPEEVGPTKYLPNFLSPLTPAQTQTPNTNHVSCFLLPHLFFFFFSLLLLSLFLPFHFILMMMKTIILIYIYTYTYISSFLSSHLKYPIIYTHFSTPLYTYTHTNLFYLFIQIV